jgi:hypothetical protein
MSLVTLRVLDGADRGRVFGNVPTPVTIGREEGNSVQLNDERVSRFHLKIQDDDSHLVLTDLESTNGTKVNGESVLLWLLRHGDVINVGRTTLLFGSQEEIAERLTRLRGKEVADGVILEEEPEYDSPLLPDGDFLKDDEEAKQLLHTLFPPKLPGRMTPGQAAELAELLHYVHLRLKSVIHEVAGPGRNEEHVTLPMRPWQNLLDLHNLVAVYLRNIGEPEEE